MDEQHRKFGIIDGMILIAGSAAGFGLIRLTHPDLTPGDVWGLMRIPEDGWSLESAFFLYCELADFLVCLIAGWTLACLLTHLLDPRPAWRRLRQRPGFVACVVPMFVLVVDVGLTATCVRLSIFKPTSTTFDAFFLHYLWGVFLAGWGVLWSWGTMAFCGVWLAEPAWIDRLGRLIGMAWIVLSVPAAIFLTMYLGLR
jgi:hypothetical protein